MFLYLIAYQPQLNEDHAVLPTTTNVLPSMSEQQGLVITLDNPLSILVIILSIRQLVNSKITLNMTN